ncbi:MAG: PQQ-binding-like beta-propeller repeat protein [Planctomycetota bacterium]
MSTDRAWRDAERELGATPTDAAGWVRLSHAQERAGALGAAGESALRAAALDPDPATVARARALGWHGFWPAPTGPGAARRSPLEGPAEGVLRWRARLPRAVGGAPLVSFTGDVVLTGASAGLLIRSPEGPVQELDDWDARREPVLYGDAAGALDPARLRIGRGAVWATAIGPRRIYAHDGATVLALSAETYVEWRAPFDVLQLVAGPGGPLLATQAAVVALDPQGEPRWRTPVSRALLARGSLARAPGGVLVAGPKGASCLDPASGELRWRAQAEVSQGLVALDEARAFLAQRQHGLAARGLEDGRVHWTRPDLSGIAALLRAGDAQLLVLRSAQVLSLDAASGETRWALAPTVTRPLSGLGLGPAGQAYVAAGRELLALG